MLQRYTGSTRLSFCTENASSSEESATTQVYLRAYYGRHQKSGVETRQARIWDEAGKATHRELFRQAHRSQDEGRQRHRDGKRDGPFPRLLIRRRPFVPTQSLADHGCLRWNLISKGSRYERPSLAQFLRCADGGYTHQGIADSQRQESREVE